MNEIIFALDIISVVLFTLGALAIGKHALVALICLQAVLANLFVVKQMTLFGMDVTCSDIFIIGSVLGLNLLQEYFGKPIAKKTIWVTFLVLLFYLVVSQFQILYIPNSYDMTHKMFASILQFMPRLTIASISVFLLVQRIDCWLYGILKKFFAGKYLVARNVCSIFCTQLIDTVLFSFLGLYGMVGSILDVMIVSFAIKIIIIFATTPFIALSKKVVKKYDLKIDGATHSTPEHPELVEGSGRMGEEIRV